jgi:hypothetical protein
MSWENEARGILKAELARRGITYATLAKRLQAIDVHETERSIANKMSRGSYSFVFFLQCLSALGLEETTITVPRARRDVRETSA